MVYLYTYVCMYIHKNVRTLGLGLNFLEFRNTSVIFLISMPYIFLWDMKNPIIFNGNSNKVTEHAKFEMFLCYWRLGRVAASVLAFYLNRRYFILKRLCFLLSLICYLLHQVFGSQRKLTHCACIFVRQIRQYWNHRWHSIIFWWRIIC